MLSHKLVSDLQQLTLPQLRIIAIKCGILNKGNKLELAQRILQEISKTRLINNNFTPHRILSIDVGIRNLAFSSIIAPSIIIEDFNLIHHKPFVVDGWDKLSIESKKIDNKIIKKAYNPSKFSFLAYQLAKSLLKKFKPQTILIERQRCRTRGKNVVQEWIIKINIFENMLHSIFRCFKEEMIWNDQEADILSIDPAKISSFWFEKNNILMKNFPINHNLPMPIDSKDKKPSYLSKTSTLRSKKEKIEIINSWLKAGSIFDFRNTQITAKDFISKKKEKDKLKIDDLADSLLQGISWIIWEQNKWILKQKLQHNKPLYDFF
ncbi:hypothetical protein PNEG_01649 [Pneumocystis murina B123]|uniref:Mitochondrial resolvase Ydc2 catalytic domain-containing protein n=1 Tax=Pneumocystis murina (strain B123) TaxID=1069680 RepID=M7NS04_PNEMU|nr:hypothetical protein PNEG_01649 [Pneumocystis murina B123]EMR09886.1 hypothetical protein PNEG_01649 [Pneumocystis murina B123]